MRYDMPPKHLPSPSEIARVAAEIRAGWSPRERRLRIVPAYRNPSAAVVKVAVTMPRKSVGNN